MRVMATPKGYGRSQTCAIRGGGRGRECGCCRLPPSGPAVRRWATAMASTTSSPYSTRFKLVAIFVLALAIAAFVAAYFATSDEGDDQLGTSAAIGNDIVEQRIPAPNSQVPQQSTVGVDLVSGWEGTLVLNDVEIPADQLKLTPELARIEFTPGDGKVVEQLRAGLNCVTAVVWPIAESRDTARQIPWCFTVV